MFNPWLTLWFFMNFYQLQRKLREGNAFTPVCHSVHGSLGKVSSSGYWRCLWVWGCVSGSGVSASELGVSTTSHPLHTPLNTSLLDTAPGHPSRHTPLGHTHTPGHTPAPDTHTYTHTHTHTHTQTSPPLEAGGMHPTEMHSRIMLNSSY